MHLVTPSLEHLDAYRAALETGWSPRTTRPEAALAALLPEARRTGLTAVDLTADPVNTASVRVIEANGGRLVTRRVKMPAHGGGQDLLYRVELPK